MCVCVFFLFSPAYIHSNQIMGWGEKAIEIRSVETGHLDGVFMHKRAQRLKFLCERNDKVRKMTQFDAEHNIQSLRFWTCLLKTKKNICTDCIIWI